jgi:hypothetical protein
MILYRHFISGIARYSSYVSCLVSSGIASLRGQHQAYATRRHHARGAALYRLSIDRNGQCPAWSGIVKPIPVVRVRPEAIKLSGPGKRVEQFPDLAID